MLNNGIHQSDDETIMSRPWAHKGEDHRIGTRYKELKILLPASKITRKLVDSTTF